MNVNETLNNITDFTKYNYIYGGTLKGQEGKIKNGYYLKNDGTEVAHAAYYYTDYIYIKDVFAVQGINTYYNQAPSICFYDKDKKFISAVNYNSIQDLKAYVPQNTVYCRYSVYKSSAQTICWFNILTYEDAKTQTINETTMRRYFAKTIEGMFYFVFNDGYKLTSGLAKLAEGLSSRNLLTVVDNGSASTYMNEGEFNIRYGRTTAERDRIYFKPYSWMTDDQVRDYLGQVFDKHYKVYLGTF